jgi:signal peptidase I
MKLLTFICLLVIIGIWLVIIWKYKWEVIVVRGRSMFPTLHDGDLVLIDKKPKAYNIGDICVLVPPDDNDKIVIKRITKVMGVDIYNGKSTTNFWFLGDNRNNSYDSRDYGWVNIENIEGRVIKQWRRKKTK